VVAIAAIQVVPRLLPSTGTVLIVVAGRTADSLLATEVRLHGSGGWAALGSVSGDVPAAPTERDLLAVSVAAGIYDGVSLGDDTATLAVKVSAGQVEPILLGVAIGDLIPGAAYAGNDQVNLGLGELSGKFVAMPPFSLLDQAGQAFDFNRTAGTDLVIAAFHTTCHQTCPLYTALFFQLQKHLPVGVALVEVTTDPATDTPAALNGYAHAIGAGWTFATGSADALAEFWKPFGVKLATGDSHVSTLALVDRHGYVRLVYRGVPNVGHEIPPALVTTLGAEGLHELASGGDGWGSPDVLQALLTISGPEAPASSSGGRAPVFSLMTTDGGQVGTAQLSGRPLVINFWASYCPPCKAEMPMLSRVMSAQRTVQLVLINEGDTRQRALDFLREVGVAQPSLLDADLSVGHAYGAIALPTTMFVNADGTVAGRQLGQLDERVLTAQLVNLQH
jgi:cytochrome oxidase Cu insertion factor (SCO1/SenC/PrrC family)